MSAVQRIHTDGGSHVEPALDPDWPPLERLRWHAAVVAFDTGLGVRIEPSKASRTVNGVTYDIPNLYSVMLSGPAMSSSTSGMDYDRAWTYLNGVSGGAAALRGEAET